LRTREVTRRSGCWVQCSRGALLPSQALGFGVHGRRAWVPPSGRGRRGWRHAIRGAECGGGGRRSGDAGWAGAGRRGRAGRGGAGCGGAAAGDGDAVGVAGSVAACGGAAVCRAGDPVRAGSPGDRHPRARGHTGARSGFGNRSFRGRRGRPAGGVDLAPGRGAVELRARAAAGRGGRRSPAWGGDRHASVRALRGRVPAPGSPHRWGIREPAAVPGRGAAGGTAADGVTQARGCAVA
jgi:hypothetical protein